MLGIVFFSFSLLGSGVYDCYGIVGVVTILPPMLTYYQHPQSIEDMTTHIVGKIMREFRLEAPGFRRWEGS